MKNDLEYTEPYVDCPMRAMMTSFGLKTLQEILTHDIDHLTIKELRERIVNEICVKFVDDDSLLQDESLSMKEAMIASFNMDVLRNFVGRIGLKVNEEVEKENNPLIEEFFNQIKKPNLGDNNETS
tara:strand:+ start:2475 stop:2852 length:378 start_codon:yes stop_codon:yes gene_type:complete